MNEWPEAKADEAAKMWLDGQSAGIIAKALGVTRNAVVGKMHRLRLRPAPNVARTGIERWPASTRKRAWKPKPKPAAQGEPIWVKLVDLNRGMCRYPRGEKLKAEFCGAPCEGSWCMAHRKLVYSRFAEAL